MYKKLIIALGLALTVSASSTWAMNGQGNGQGKGQGNGKGADPTPTEAQMIILHKPGTPAEKVMTIPIQAWAGHERHGDRPYEPASLCSLPTSTELEDTLEEVGFFGTDFLAYATVTGCTEAETDDLLDLALSSVPVAHPNPELEGIVLLCEPDRELSQIAEEADGSYTVDIIYNCTIYNDGGGNE